MEDAVTMTIQRTPERIEFLTGVFTGACEHANYGFFWMNTYRWENVEPGEFYADIYERDGYESGDNGEAREYRLDIDVLVRGLGVIKRAVNKLFLLNPEYSHLRWEWFAISEATDVPDFGPFDSPEAAVAGLAGQGYGTDSHAIVETKGEVVLHNAVTGDRLYMSPGQRRNIMLADRTNADEGDLDVGDYLAIVECGLFGRVVYG